MREETSLPALLKVVLSLPDNAPVFATPSFHRWGGCHAEAWPPRSNARGLRLVDTRDQEARRWADAWKGDPQEPAFDAALILGRARLELLPRLRRILRDLRNPRTRRLGEARLEDMVSAPHVHRLGYREHLGVPASFSLAERTEDTGTAFLLTRSPPFSGPIWDEIRKGLDATELEIREFHLRARGAAVVPLVADGDGFVVRLVKNPTLQDRVRENHAALRRVRRILEGNEGLRSLLPDPVFARSADEVLLLAETAVPGTLAWKVAGGPLDDTIHREAVRFLERMRDETKEDAPLDPDAVRNLVDHDVGRLDAAPFVDDSIQRLLRSELDEAADELTRRSPVPSTSHGDYGYGNILVDPESGEVRGVIDWDTAQLVDLPHLDRINLEIQIHQGVYTQGFAEAVRRVWEALERGEIIQDFEERLGRAGFRAVFGVAVARYIIRSLPYPQVFHDEADGFREALTWLREVPRGEE